MQGRLVTELRQIAATRRGLGLELVALLAVLSLTAWAETLGASRVPETATLLILGLVALAAGSLRWATRLAGLLAEPCPRCGRAFFVSLERMMWSLPFPRGRCAHCGLGLHPPRPERDAPDATA